MVILSEERVAVVRNRVCENTLMLYLSIATGMMRDGGTKDPLTGMPMTFVRRLHMKEASSVARCSVFN